MHLHDNLHYLSDDVLGEADAAAIGQEALHDVAEGRSHRFNHDAQVGPVLDYVDQIGKVARAGNASEQRHLFL